MTTAADLKFVSANADGSMGTTVVQSVENSLWPDVMPTERVSGARTTKRLYAAALSADAYPLVGAQVGIAALPTDAAIELLLTGPGVDPSAAWAGETSNGMATNGAFWPVLGGFADGVAGSNVVSMSATDVTGLSVGELIGLYKIDGTAQQRLVTAAILQAKPTSTTVQLDRNLPTAVSGSVWSRFTRRADAQISTVGKTAAALAAAGTSIALTSIFAPVSGKPAASPMGKVGTYVPRFFAGDLVLLMHTNGTTREWATVSAVNYLTKTLTFSAGVANAYPSGSLIAFALSLGDLQSRVSVTPFSLQTWARAWADALPSGALAPTGRYTGVPAVNNAGTITERWALVFRSDSIFDVIGERLGQIATGNIGTDFKPLNPMTNEPYFELQASLWSGGLLPGNAVRFNTVGASAAFDAHRVLAAGSVAGGTVQGTLFISGAVNA